MFDDSPKRGLRIDHIMISENLLPVMRATGIDYEASACNGKTIRSLPGVGGIKMKII